MWAKMSAEKKAKPEKLSKWSDFFWKLDIKMILNISKKQGQKVKRHLRRKIRIRKKVTGSDIRPRLTVYRSLNHIYAQVINDGAGNTLASACSTEKGLEELVAGKKKAEVSKVVGETLGARLKEKGIVTVVFDRNGRNYHGRVKSLADGVRLCGIEF